MSQTHAQAWKVIPVPKKKPDWRYKSLRLECIPPLGGQIRSAVEQTLPIRIHDIARILMRRRAADTAHVCSIPDVSSWGNIHVLELGWKCPHCGTTHHVMIPESWVAERKAIFVEQVEE